MQENFQKMAQLIWSPKDPHRWASLPLPSVGLRVHIQLDLELEEAPGYSPIRWSPTLQNLREGIQKSFNHKSFRVWAQPEAHTKLQTLSQVTALVNYKHYMRLGTIFTYKGFSNPLLRFGISLLQVIIGRPLTLYIKKQSWDVHFLVMRGSEPKWCAAS